MFNDIAYLGLLLVSLGGLVVLDYRFRLALSYDAVRTVKTIAAAAAVFIVWDALGIANGIFRVGDSPYLTGIRLGHEFPLEELFFLILLVYTALLLWRGGVKI